MTFFETKNEFFISPHPRCAFLEKKLRRTSIYILWHKDRADISELLTKT